MGSRIYQLNDTYFEKIDTETKAYILGFLYADGSVSANKYYLSIDISIEDIEIIDLISKELYITPPKYMYKTIKNRKYVKLCVGSKKICSDLINLGCIPNKTFLIKFPNENQVPNYLLSHFIRGYFDGDGCITTKEGIRPMATIIGTLDFLDGVYNILNFNNIKKRCMFKISKIYRLSISNLKDNYYFYHYIYNNSTVYLKRKKDKYDTYYEIMLKNKDKTLTSKHKGIFYDKARNKWGASVNGKRLGRFSSEEEALTKRNNYIKENNICEN
ncbi:LAGLIDADG family homing endonuclease [Clostridium sp.]|uniref:LAGLIDADG family homing endonuclease n=1 Tax=Clostridium sp. TaxID=1506 RepID=UPI0026141FF2|nr:LAGLIDADG family homing endonuclease [Clostridium sp.]